MCLACCHQSLLSKAIKYEERLSDVEHARALLSRLREVSVDKCWRTLLEGAQLEARSGNSRVARLVFSFLMEHVHWCGPVYSDAVKFEERCGQDMRALKIVNKYVTAICWVERGEL